MSNKLKITMVSLEQPCSACLIIEGHLKEMLEKLHKRVDNIYIEHIVLKDLREVHNVEGLELEKFPALLINDEQITAGSLPPLEQLLGEIKKHL